MQPQAQKVIKLLPGAAKGEFLYLPFFLALLLQASGIEDPHKNPQNPVPLKLSLIMWREQKNISLAGNKIKTPDDSPDKWDQNKGH